VHWPRKSLWIWIAKCDLRKVLEPKQPPIKTRYRQMEIHKNPREAARRMIQDGIPLEKVARMTGLEEEALQEIAAGSCFPNVLVPQNPQRAKPLPPAVS